MRQGDKREKRKKTYYGHNSNISQVRHAVIKRKKTLFGLNPLISLSPGRCQNLFWLILAAAATDAATPVG